MLSTSLSGNRQKRALLCLARIHKGKGCEQAQDGAGKSRDCREENTGNKGGQACQTDAGHGLQMNSAPRLNALIRVLGANAPDASKWDKGHPSAIDPEYGSDGHGYGMQSRRGQIGGPLLLAGQNGVDRYQIQNEKHRRSFRV